MFVVTRVNNMHIVTASGCIEVDKYSYQGSANVTASGLPCFYWDDPLIIPKLSYRVSERERNATLTGHNYCRNVGGESQPWCFAGKKRNRQPCAIPTCWNKGMLVQLLVMNFMVLITFSVLCEHLSF
jgi:hypothetical protein